MYLTYAEYQSMGGTLDETTFNNFEFEAEATINWYTFNRLKKDTVFPIEIKRLMYYLINQSMLKDNAISTSGGGSSITGGKTVVSQANDGVSVSYNVLGAKEFIDILKADNENVVNQYLQGVMNEAGRLLLYRGIYPDE